MEEINPLAGKKKEIKASVTTSSLMQDETEVAFSEAQLLAVKAIVDSVVKAQSESSAKLVEAIIESKKPYVDPGQAMFDKMAKENSREVAKRHQEMLENERLRCGHLQGSHSLSSFTSPYGLTSIIHHRTDVNELVGICSNCGRIFRSGDPDYMQQMNRKSGNLPSSAGPRNFMNQQEAIERGRLVNKP